MQTKITITLMFGRSSNSGLLLRSQSRATSATLLWPRSTRC